MEKITIARIAGILEQYAPLRLAEGFDNTGLLVGNPSGMVSSALICVDVTDAVIDEACRLGVNLIISHHPLIFHPLKKLIGNGQVQRLVARAIREDISLYACHTNLDGAPAGMSFKLGSILGLTDMEVLSEKTDEPGAGIGIIGGGPDCCSHIEYLRLLKERLGLGVIRASRPLDMQVGRVAICTGSGAFLMDEAAARGADFYISADFKYNDFIDADGRMTIADIGHFESEYCAIDLIFDIIRKKLPNFALHKSVESSNPITYIY